MRNPVIVDLWKRLERASLALHEASRQDEFTEGRGDYLEILDKRLTACYSLYGCIENISKMPVFAKTEFARQEMVLLLCHNVMVLLESIEEDIIQHATYS